MHFIGPAYSYTRAHTLQILLYGKTEAICFSGRCYYIDPKLENTVKKLSEKVKIQQGHFLKVL